MTADTENSDSQKQLGGIIPGSPGIHAYTITGPQPSAIPVVIAVPHAGRAYPASLLRTLRSPEAAALRLEDRLVDSLGRSVAGETGAMLLVANAPRAMIDLNRAPGDVDWEMFDRSDRPDFGSHTPSRRARSGLGLIPRRVPGTGELWNRRHRRDELESRVAGIHHPYHTALADMLEMLRARWGAAVLIDLHSMPPIPPRGSGASPQFVLGDRFGASCHGSLSGAILSYFESIECSMAHNRPYAGGYVLDRHADPRRGIHAVQIEIDRSVYLDNELLRLGGGYAGLVRVLTRLVRIVAAVAINLADSSGMSGWPQAAE